MKQLLLAGLFVFAAPVADAAVDAPTTASLIVEAVGVSGAGGEVRGLVFGSRDAYAGEEPPVRNMAAEPGDDGRARLAFPDLPVGHYAVLVFLDRNGNGELDRGFLGRPLEPYGFSNNVRGKTGPPDFDAIRFELQAGGARLEIELR